MYKKIYTITLELNTKITIDEKLVASKEINFMTIIF